MNVNIGPLQPSGGVLNAPHTQPAQVGYDAQGRRYIRCFDLGGSGLKTALVYHNRQTNQMEIVPGSSHQLGRCPDNREVADWVREKMKMADGSDLDREIRSGMHFGLSLAGPNFYKLRHKAVNTGNAAKLLKLPEKKTAWKPDGSAHLLASLNTLREELPPGLGRVWNFSIGTGVGFALSNKHKQLHASEHMKLFFGQDAWEVKEPTTGLPIWQAGGSREGFDKILQRLGNKDLAIKEFADRWEHFIRQEILARSHSPDKAWGSPTSIVFTGGHMDYHGAALVEELNRRNLGVSIFAGAREAGLIGAAWTALAIM